MFKVHYIWCVSWFWPACLGKYVLTVTSICIVRRTMLFHHVHILFIFVWPSFSDHGFPSNGQWMWQFIGKPFARSIDRMTAPFGPMNWEHWCILFQQVAWLNFINVPNILTGHHIRCLTQFTSVFNLNSHSKTSLFSAGTVRPCYGPWTWMWTSTTNS